MGIYWKVIQRTSTENVNNFFIHEKYNLIYQKCAQS